MRIAKILLCTLMMMAVLNGCFKKKKGDGSLVGTDTPLEAFPLDSFTEASGAAADVLKNVYFDYNKYNIKADQKTVAEGVAAWLKDKPKTHVLIEGHCDERGSNEYNMALGEQRALAVRQIIVDNGIPAGRLQTISYGEEKPVEKGHTEASWSKNRRAHFLVAEEK